MTDHAVTECDIAGSDSRGTGSDKPLVLDHGGLAGAVGGRSIGCVRLGMHVVRVDRLDRGVAVDDDDRGWRASFDGGAVRAVDRDYGVSR